MGRLLGYRAVVTGAGSGIGRAVVRRYIAEGANVVAVVRRETDVAALQAEGAQVVVGDVAAHATSAQAVHRATELWGGLDVFVANAGIWDFHKRVAKQTSEELQAAFDQLFAINVKGPLFGAHAALDALRASKGSVIVTGSNACFLAGGGGSLYTASKFALRGLVMQLASEWAPDVRVNGVAPGATDTAISGVDALGQAQRTMNADPDRMATMAAHIPLRRVAAPDDHAALYVLLASREESAYVTGAMLRSDGGLTLSV